MGKKNRKKKIVWIRLFISIFLMYSVFCITNQRISIYKLNKVKKEISEAIEESKMENEKLEDLLKNATNQESIEKMAREQLGLVKPNETVYVDQASSDSDFYLQEGGN